MTGGNLPPVTPSTDWIFLEAIDTLRSPPPWDVADFQRLFCWLRRSSAGPSVARQVARGILAGLMSRRISGGRNDAVEVET